MSNEPTELEVEKYLKQKLLRRALDGFDNIDLRTARSFQTLGLIKEEENEPNFDLEVLSNQNSDRRIDGPAGPFLIHKTENEYSNNALDLRDALLSKSKRIRIESLKEIRRLVSTKKIRISSKSNHLTKEERKRIGSRKPDNWIKSSITLYDILREDFFISCHGYAQCLAHGINDQETTSQLIAKILNPNFDNIEPIDLGLNAFSLSKESLKITIKSITHKSDSLEELIFSYIRELGFLPLCKEFSLGQCISDWTEKHSHENAINIKTLIDSHQNNELTIFHLTLCALQFPHLFPDSENKWLYINSFNLLNLGPTHTGIQSLQFRHLLAKHYLQLLETTIPNNPNYLLSITAWKLTDIVISTLGDFSSRFGEGFFLKFDQALKNSSRAWFSACPTPNPSSIRRATFACTNIWSTSIYKNVTLEILDSLKDESTDEIREALNKALIKHSLEGLCGFTQGSIFAFELDANIATKQISNFLWPDEGDGIDKLLELHSRFNQFDKILIELRKISELNQLETIFLTSAFRNVVYDSKDNSEKVVNLFSEKQWIEDNLLKLDIKQLPYLLESVLILQSKDNETWFTEFPHYLAEACLISTSKDHQEVLFSALVSSCLMLEVFSAFDRLFSSDKRQFFLRLSKEYRHPQEFDENFPPWIQGKYRSLAAQLNQ